MGLGMINRIKNFANPTHQTKKKKKKKEIKKTIQEIRLSWVESAG